MVGLLAEIRMGETELLDSKWQSSTVFETAEQKSQKNEWEKSRFPEIAGVLQPPNLQSDSLLISDKEDAYTAKGYALPVVEFIKDHPVATGAVLATGAALFVRRMISKSVDRALANIGESAVISAELQAGRTSFLSELANGPAIAEQAREKYAGDLMRLACLPKSAVGLADETMEGFAARTMRSRFLTTGESITKETIEKEAQRITALNSEILAAGSTPAELNVAGKTLKTMNHEHLARLAEEMQASHLPSVERLLKAPIAAKSDVELATAGHRELSGILTQLKEKFLSIEIAHALKMQ